MDATRDYGDIHEHTMLEPHMIASSRKITISQTKPSLTLLNDLVTITQLINDVPKKRVWTKISPLSIDFKVDAYGLSEISRNGDQ